MWMYVLVVHAAAKHTEEPHDYKEALRIPQWHEAMEVEFSALHRNGTWKLLPLVTGNNLIDTCWILK
jgi:hypothetical protein